MLCPHLSPNPRGLGGLQRRWDGPGGRLRRPAGTPEPAGRAEAQSERLAETGKAAGSSDLPKRLWRGYHGLMGTERCLWQPNLVLRSDWGEIFSPLWRHFCCTPNLLSLPIYGSCLPRPLPLPNHPLSTKAATLWLKSEPRIPGGGQNPQRFTPFERKEGQPGLPKASI